MDCKKSFTLTYRIQGILSLYTLFYQNILVQYIVYSPNTTTIRAWYIVGQPFDCTTTCTVLPSFKSLLDITSFFLTMLMLFSSTHWTTTKTIFSNFFARESISNHLEAIQNSKEGAKVDLNGFCYVVHEDSHVNISLAVIGYHRPFADMHDCGLISFNMVAWS